MNTKNILLIVAILFIAGGIFMTMKSKNESEKPELQIYLCFGQSNMEGQGEIEPCDTTVDKRFKTMQSFNCSDLEVGKWRTAVPPLFQCTTGLSPADYFGRTMIENLPENVSVGVICVAIGGCDIRLFDKDIYTDYCETYPEKWFTDKVKGYGGNPYQRIIDLAKSAQEQGGVIKGILLHQGETNTGDEQWPSYVKKIYNDMLNDLSLNAEDVPLLAGEVFSGENNCCSAMNPIINTLPDTIPTAYVISSEGCPGQDEAHFTSAGYRTLGKRYAEKMLSIMKSDK